MTAIQHGAVDALHAAMAEATASAGEAVSLRELPLLTHVSIRIDPAAAHALGIALPEPGTFAPGPPAVLWLGPDEWLALGGPDLEAALRGRGAVTVDVSDQRTVLELAGARAREILATGCSIDLHPRAFGPGRCVQTLFARAGVIVLQLDDAPTYRLLVRRSFAAYVTSWLLDAMTDPDDSHEGG